MHLAASSRAYTLFATHYFELTELAGEYAGIANVHLDAVEYGEQLVFMHAVKDGPANRSFGLQVAALAGLPKPVIADARRTLAALEKGLHPGGASARPEHELAAARPVRAARSLGAGEATGRSRSGRAVATRGAGRAVPAESARLTPAAGCNSAPAETRRHGAC